MTRPVKWLIEKGWDVVCFMADIGQEEDFEAAREKAKNIGAIEVNHISLEYDYES